MNEPELILKKTRKKHNPYGYETIEILKFNYDGNNGIITKADGYLTVFGNGDTEEILHSGFYELA